MTAVRRGTCGAAGAISRWMEVARQIIATADASPRVNIRTKIGLLSEITSVEIWDLSTRKKESRRTARSTAIVRPATYTSDPDPARPRGSTVFLVQITCSVEERTLPIITSSIIRAGIGRRAGIGKWTGRGLQFGQGATQSIKSWEEEEGEEGAKK